MSNKRRTTKRSNGAQFTRRSLEKQRTIERRNARGQKLAYYAIASGAALSAWAFIIYAAQTGLY